MFHKLLHKIKSIFCLKHIKLNDSVEVNTASKKAIDDYSFPAVLLSDKPPHNILYVNKKYTKLTNYTLEDVYMKLPNVFYDGTLQECEVKTIIELIEKNEVWSGVIKLKTKRKRYIKIHIVFFSIISNGQRYLVAIFK